MRKLNAGCGSVQPEGWVNADIADYGQGVLVDFQGTTSGHSARPTEFVRYQRWIGGAVVGLRRESLNEEWGNFDVIVANHLLSCFSHHELPVVLGNLRTLLAEGGVLRVLVPNATLAAEAFLAGDRGWFPQGEDLPTVDEAFCTFLPWFGESKSIFTDRYLAKLLKAAGFSHPGWVRCGVTTLSTAESTELDDRCGEALIMEARR